MKKALVILFLFTSLAANAQNGMPIQVQENLTRGLMILALFCLIVFFVLTVLQRILDHRLRNKIIDKGITDGLAASLLKDHPKENTQSAIKWFCLLGATGAGLVVVYYTMPLNIHSLAIMAISLSIAFLGYYFFLKQSEK
jgi:hypothetical protein